MKSIVVIAIVIGCAATFANAGPISNEEARSYDDKIIATGNEAEDIAQDLTHGKDDKRTDLGNTANNVYSFLTRIIAIVNSFAYLNLLKSILRGVNKQSKKGNGNIVGVLKGATNGLIDGVHLVQAHDVGQLLSEGKSPNIYPKAAKIIAKTDYGLKLAKDKQAKSNKGLSNLGGLLNNFSILLKLLPTYALMLGTQPTVQLAGTTVKGALDGLSKGSNQGPVKGITGTLKGGSEGLDTGLQNAGVNVYNKNLPIGK